MSNKKIIIIILILSALLILFLNTAFKKIQTVELTIKMDTECEIPSDIVNYFELLAAHRHTPFVKDITLYDIGLPVLLVDHADQRAALIDGDEITVVDYQALDTAIIYCNSYIVYNKKQPTLVLNCDLLLGDVVERLITSAYQFYLNSQHGLNPQSIEYFETLDGDTTERYYRHQMICSLEKVYLENQSLDRFHADYHKWREHVGETYLDVVNYDYHDGLNAYIAMKVKQELDEDFDEAAFLQSMENAYGIYSKESEYRALGLLWCLVAEREGLDIFDREDGRMDCYQALLRDVPLGSFGETETFDDFEERYNHYISELATVVESCRKSQKNFQPQALTLTCESYGQTVKLAENHYVYLDYVARNDQSDIIRSEHMLVKVQPYKVLYYINK